MVDDGQWVTTIRNLEKLHGEGRSKELHAEVNRLTKIKPGNPIVKGIKNDDGTEDHDERVVHKKIAESMIRLQESFRTVGQSESDSERPWKAASLFTGTEIEEAMAACNFSKAIGND